MHEMLDALEDVHKAVAADDLDAARDATFRLEDTCVGCHRALRERAVDKP
jgi:cytochrome c556